MVVSAMSVKGFEDLRIWQAAYALALQIYEVSASFPASELYGLTNQMRRSAASIAGNIAEGYGRFSRPEYMHFLYYARGSLMETRSYLYLARDLGYLEANGALILFDNMESLGVKLNNTIAAIKRAQRTKPAKPDEP